ncbi:hypothetical protein C1646_812972 [Rhizophagus diaphanus]|nr:hypothetical protein C1646_812972 [Rhizophagus diaphanus] [Rhizophagus sp. MUCL 43196]
MSPLINLNPAGRCEKCAKKYKRMVDLFKTIALKCFYDTPNIINEFLSERKLEYSKYLKGKTNFPIEPICDAIFKWCISCQKNYFEKIFTNWTSENEKIDDFIQEIQLKNSSYNDIILEWMPYDRFNRDLAIATWKNGPLYYSRLEKELIREPKNYSQVYGMSQNPDTKDCIMVFQYERCERCGRKYIDSLKVLDYPHYQEIGFISYSGARDCLKNPSELYYCSSDITVVDCLPDGLIDLISVQQSLKFVDCLPDLISLLMTRVPNTLTKLKLYGGGDDISLSFIIRLTKLQELQLSFEVKENKLLIHYERCVPAVTSPLNVLETLKIIVAEFK